MADYVAIAIEGVLARTTEPLPAALPIPQGLDLYVALKRNYKVALLTHEFDTGKVEHWCRINGVSEHTLILRGETREQALISLRASGYNVALFVDASPQAVADALHLGITGLVFASPVYARPEFRPDAKREIRQWDAIERELHEQAAARELEPKRTADLYD